MSKARMQLSTIDVLIKYQMERILIVYSSLLNEVAKDDGKWDMDVLMVKLDQLDGNIQKYHLSLGNCLEDFQESAITVKTWTKGGRAGTEATATSKPVPVEPKHA